MVVGEHLILIPLTVIIHASITTRSWLNSTTIGHSSVSGPRTASIGIKVVGHLSIELVSSLRLTAASIAPTLSLFPDLVAWRSFRRASWLWLILCRRLWLCNTFTK
jgi:hypothetical protein